VILKTWGTYTNHAQETFLVNMPARLQDKQETTQCPCAHRWPAVITEYRWATPSMIMP